MAYLLCQVLIFLLTGKFMIKKRIISGIMFGFIVIYLLSFSPEQYHHLFFSIFAAVIITLAGTEYLSLIWNLGDKEISEKEKSEKEKSYPIIKLPHILMGMTYGIPIFLFYLFLSNDICHFQKTILILLLWIFSSILFTAIFLYKFSKNLNAGTLRFFLYIAGFFYLSIPTICLVHLTYLQFPNVFRNSLVYFSLLTIIASDVGAFFIGTRFGKHKLIPSVSPKKSIEGALGGLASSSLVAVLFSVFFHFPINSFYLIFVGFMTAFTGQIGDLVESAIKRVSGYKDSGILIPGHGGFLDRIDSLIMGIPVTYLLFFIYVYFL